MKTTECHRTVELEHARQTGFWTDDLRNHIATCSECSFLQSCRTDLLASSKVAREVIRVPHYKTILLATEIRRRTTTTRKKRRRVIWLQTMSVGMAVSLGVIIATFLGFESSAVDSWLRHPLLPPALLFILLVFQTKPFINYGRSS